MQAVRSLPERSEQRIEELKAAVKEGAYQVSAEDIAEKIRQESFER